ncbi:MAG: ribonuclease III [Deltaproteobacteria bacterium]|nr:ribonuclease III [Deltaproteobacteria bacterium]
MKREEELKRFKKRLQFSFKDEPLLHEVFVHASYLNEKGGKGMTSNERLEFLGDAVLSSAVSHILFKRFPALDEGELTRLRARLINGRTLAELSDELGLGPLMLLGKGEKKTKGSENPSILSDAFEALVAAISLDRGYEAAFSFIERLFNPLLEVCLEEAGHFDFKPRLQELAQRYFKQAPQYRLIREEGPAHRKSFSVEVMLGGEVLGLGVAMRKKDAEQVSAKQALEVLEKRGYTTGC